MYFFDSILRAKQRVLSWLARRKSRLLELPWRGAPHCEGLLVWAVAGLVEVAFLTVNFTTADVFYLRFKRPDVEANDAWRKGYAVEQVQTAHSVRVEGSH